MSNQTVTPSRPHVVIIGGGFGGLHAAKGLKNASVCITLIDQRNYHLFQPLLYQVATAELEPNNIAFPIRKIFQKQHNCDVVLGKVTSIDLEDKCVQVDGGKIEYDYLIVATGARQSYFGHDEYRTLAPGLKSIDDALEIRRRVLLAFEEAEWEEDAASRQAKLTFVIVGGGPTGMELAGAITELATKTLPADFHNIDTRQARVILIQGAPRLVPPMPEDLATRAHRVLEKLGVEIRLNTLVTNVTEESVEIGEEKIFAQNIFWAAGVQGQTVCKTLDVESDRAGRVVVQQDLSIPNYPKVFVVGDAAAATDALTGSPVPGVAQGAIQTGDFVAKIILNDLKGAVPKDRPAFTYYDKGSMAMVGHGNAIAAIGKVHLGGFLGWLAWNVVHAMFLVGFGNKLVVLCEWFWDYMWHTRQSRLITGDPEVSIKTLRHKRVSEDKHHTA
jgi:NADH dehydrogenase